LPAAGCCPGCYRCPAWHTGAATPAAEGRAAGGTGFAGGDRHRRAAQPGLFWRRCLYPPWSDLHTPPDRHRRRATPDRRHDYWTTGSWVQAHFATRLSRRLLIITGLVLILVGIVASASVLLPAVPVFIAPLAWGVSGMGMGL